MILITKTELTRRWSKSLVKIFAPTPFRTAPNDYGGADICYYLISDIERIERDPEFQNELDKINEQRAKQRMPIPIIDSYTLF